MPTVSMSMPMPSWIDAQSPDLAATLDILPHDSKAGLAISIEDQAMAHAVGFATDPDLCGPERAFVRRVSSTSDSSGVDDMMHATFGASAPAHSAPTLAIRRRKRVPKPLNVAAGRVVKCGLPSGQKSPALALTLGGWHPGYPDDLPTPLTPLSAATTFHSAAAVSGGGLTSALAAYFPWTSPPLTPLNPENQAFSVPMGTPQPPQQQQQQQHASPQQHPHHPQHFFTPPQSAPASQLCSRRRCYRRRRRSSPRHGTCGGRRCPSRPPSPAWIAGCGLTFPRLCLG